MERVGAVLRGIGGRGTLRRRLAEARAIARWPDLVGPQLAGRTRVLRVAGDRLFVLAPGAALRQELTFHKRTILRRFNEAAGGPAVRDVVFLESDALAGVPEASGSEGSDGAEAGTPAGRPEAGGGEGEPAQEEREEIPRGAMYAPFDAEAYRRELARIAGAAGARPSAG